ncbi:Acyl-CoA N-acyltransferase [Purpureocillium lilacinum]|uniref:Acyl-CoA N-acyltransferase n=2 Tax=Purpureocillium lilacinum TaxID=33203 RepID=A0A179HSL9_PURLI|nr:Acyl-CoA N-acyltransferase [Purpureocillium lilacinum]OAQ78803.1 Acyl-CoA N-acyltransferase [Purpureocillium lilacinum]OAQ93456.1 Acyl-CoA N-acyltransferase [Purpureocillium lilacinum]
MPPSLQASEPARRVGPYLWTHPFTHLSPQTCFVLDSGSGSDPVGYCIGCPDIAAFCAAWPSYVSSILDPSPEVQPPKWEDRGTKAPWLLDDGQINETALAQMAYQAEWLLLNGQEDLMEEGYKATMHIDLLDEWQGKGWGRKLIEAFVESVKAARQQQDGSVSRGIWIGVAADNSKVVPFYQKQGFKIKERRKQSKSTTMVREY